MSGRNKRRGAGRRIVGDGIEAEETGVVAEARPMGQLPPKTQGKHRWVATAGWVISGDAVKHAGDPDVQKFLDNENMFTLGVGCWDCEQQLGDIFPDTWCEASPGGDRI